MCMVEPTHETGFYQIGGPADEPLSDQILHFTNMEVSDSAHDQILDIQPT